jgi:hypothetical protein
MMSADVNTQDDKQNRIYFYYLKHLWASSTQNVQKQKEVWKQLVEFAPKIKNDPPLQARIYEKLGIWQLATQPTLDEVLMMNDK